MREVCKHCGNPIEDGPFTWVHTEGNIIICPDYQDFPLNERESAEPAEGIAVIKNEEPQSECV